MVFAHGLPKFLAYSEKAASFSDPLGIGPSASMALVIFAEFFCAAAVTVGFATRWTAIPVVITMLVAFGIVHANDGFDVKEHSLMFAAAFSVLALQGGGKFSLDYLLQRKGRFRFGTAGAR